MKHRDHTNGLLGYHDSDRCIVDLWSPYDPHHPHLDHERDDCAQENRAFSPFVEHQQDLEDAVNILVEARMNGEENCSVEFETEVSNEDIAWVMAEVERRLR